MKGRPKLFLAALVGLGVARMHALGGGEPPSDAWLGSVFVEAFDNGHYSGKKLEGITADILRRFVDRLDPGGVIATEEDLGDFCKKWEGRLEDDLRSGRFTAGQEIHGALLEKGRRFLGEFPSMCRNAEIPAAIDVLRRKNRRAKDEWGLPSHWLEIAFLEDMRDSGRDFHGAVGGKISSQIMELEAMGRDGIRDAFLDAAAQAYDRQSGYYSHGGHRKLVSHISLEKDGLGVDWDIGAGGGWRIKDILDGGPAGANGRLEAGDFVLAVEGGGLKSMTPVDQIAPSKARDLPEVEEGVPVTLQVSKTGRQEDSFEISLVSGRLPVGEDEAVGGRVFEIGGHRVGVVKIPAFYSSPRDFGGRTVQGDARKKILEMAKGGADCLVVDLRGDSGGSMDEAVRLGNLFESGDMAISVDRFGKEEHHGVESTPIFTGPLVVLVDAGSASASEIFAKAMQERGRGVVVGGRRTYGKGSMQNLVDLEWHGGERLVGKGKAGAIRITTRIFLGPGGGAIQGKGVVPDIRLPCPYDTALEMAYAEGSGEPEIPPGCRMSGGAESAGRSLGTGGIGEEVKNILGELRKRSGRRTEGDPAFAHLREIGENFGKLRGKGAVGTEAGEYCRQMKIFSELKDAVDDSKKRREEWGTGGPMRDPHLLEAMRVAADIADLQKQPRKERRQEAAER